MWKVNRGDETPEELAALRRQRQRMLVPGNETGGEVTVEPTVLRSADCALQLQVARMFTTGMQLQFRAVLRRQRPPGPDRGPASWWEGSLLAVSRFGDDGLWVGVELADGRTATAVGRPPGVDVPADVVTLSRTGGRSSGDTASLDYFLAPAPPPGPVTIVLTWPTLGIQESRLLISGEAIASASAKTVTLWPEELIDKRFEPRRPPQPPPGGWFEQHPPVHPST